MKYFGNVILANGYENYNTCSELQYASMADAVIYMAEILEKAVVFVLIYLAKVLSFPDKKPIFIKRPGNAWMRQKDKGVMI